MACEFCPIDQVEIGVIRRSFFLLECHVCGACFYSPGNGKRVPGWENGRLTPERKKYMEFESGDEWRRWSKARRQRGLERKRRLK